jgi:ubiquinone/menaquinone biosynthesis C-methylase UbiE
VTERTLGVAPGGYTTEAAFLELMESAQGRALAHDCYYEWDVLNACRRFENSEEWQAVRAILRERPRLGVRAIDVGAGNGIASYALARLGFRVAGVEPDPSDLVGYGAFLRMAASTRLPVEHFAAFGEELPFPNRTFAVAYTRQVLHHAQDLGSMLSEIARVLIPGGTFIACREHVVDDDASRQEFFQHHPLQPLTGGEWAFTLQEYLDAMALAGLRVRTVLGPWCSVVNHYPTSDDLLRAQMRSDTWARWGRLARLVGAIPGHEQRYRTRRSAADRTPGRLYAFVAEA